MDYCTECGTSAQLERCTGCGTVWCQRHRSAHGVDRLGFNVSVRESRRGCRGCRASELATLIERSDQLPAAHRALLSGKLPYGVTPAQFWPEAITWLQGETAADEHSLAFVQTRRFRAARPVDVVVRGWLFEEASDSLAPSTALVCAADGLVRVGPPQSSSQGIDDWWRTGESVLPWSRFSFRTPARGELSRRMELHIYGSA